MDYVIAIPSYKRADTIAYKTLRVLDDYSIPHDKIHVFSIPEEEDEYRKVIPEDIHLHPGIKGLVEQREFIHCFFPIGTKIIFADDDLEGFMGLDRKAFVDVDSAFRKGFEMCLKEGTTIFGLYPVTNPFFMSDTISTSLKFIIGSCYGVINSKHRQQPPYSDAEDFWRSCWYYKNEEKIVRLNFISPKTKYYSGSGGLNGARTLESNAEGKRRVYKDFPEYAKPWTRKRTGMLELRLRDTGKSKPKQDKLYLK